VKVSAPSVVTLAELYDFLVMVEELCGSEVDFANKQHARQQGTDPIYPPAFARTGDTV